MFLNFLNKFQTKLVALINETKIVCQQTGFTLFSDVCELGQYYDLSTGACVDCYYGFYQDNMYQLSCKPCADSYWTKQLKSTSSESCLCMIY